MKYSAVATICVKSRREIRVKPINLAIHFRLLNEIFVSTLDRKKIMRSTKGYAALSPTSPLAPFTFERRDIGESDIGFEIAYAGICHSDIHQVREEWGPALYPMVPGHEIVGIVSEVGASVTKFRVGDRIGVGVFIDSCRNCTNCNLAGSMIGGMPELQEMLDFCGERSISRC
jgi:D-arabinose 1-dehydrogenase-like Zn-dependent alcohol dehydrogenase